MTKQKIVTIGPLPDWVRQHFMPQYEIQTVGDAARQDVLQAVDDSVIAIIARGSVIVDAEIMDRAPHLKVVSRTGVGFDSVCIPDANQRGIPVVYTPGAMSRGVAEHALSLMLGAYKRLNEWRDALLRSDWDIRYRLRSLDLQDSVLGIVGYGRIGRQVRRLVSGFDMRVLVDDPYIDHSAFSDHDIEFVDLDGILSRSDIITLHVPLNEETTGLINSRNVEKVKRGATLINTARGPVIEGLDFLHECLQQGIFGAIGLDVFPDEPPDTSHPLFRDPRCYLTGHVAARSPISQQRILDTMLKETLALLHGEMPDPSNIVNPEVLPRP